MLPDKVSKTLSKIVDELSKVCDEGNPESSLCYEGLPSLSDIRKIIDILWQVFFPELYYERAMASRLEYKIGVDIDRLFMLLQGQIARSLAQQNSGGVGGLDLDRRASALAADIVGHLPELKRLLFTDIKAILHKDPAAENEIEIILCYPSVKSLLHHRFAHLMHKMGIPFLPRTISELSHSITGIDIHPGATIGEYFAIDHGTGIVIGETCIIGNHVTIYQGVTLGAKSFQYDEKGSPLNIPRHPILEDNVTVYSNATILGRVTIGHDTVIGGNVWLTRSVPPHSMILQGGTRYETYTDGAGI